MGTTVFQDGGDITVRVDGTFDSDDAVQLRSVFRRVCGEHAHAGVVVDLTRAREVTPTALAALSDLCAEFDRLRLRGLSRHSARLLAHLTARTSAAADRALDE